MNYKKNIWLFGGGGACSWIISGLKRENVEIKGILDDNPNKTENIYGIPLFSSSTDKINKTIKDNDIIVISILNPLVDISKIIKNLQKDGWKNILEFGEWVELYYKQSGNVAAPLTAKSWVDKTNELLAVKNLLADEQSKQVLECFINFVKEGKNKFLPIEPCPYFPKNLKKWSSPLHFIDCGAFTGDTLLEIEKEGYEIGSAQAFEPDIPNYNEMVINCKIIKNAVFWPCGVGDKNASLRFQTQNNMGSFVDPNGNSVIQCVRLDDCLPNYMPNLIKMDIEGYELNALQGAESILKKHLPGLAISVYHLADDIWQIPLYLSTIYNNKAKFYLRNHSRTIADTILYVIPE